MLDQLLLLVQKDGLGRLSHAVGGGIALSTTEVVLRLTLLDGCIAGLLHAARRRFL